MVHDRRTTNPPATIASLSRRHAVRQRPDEHRLSRDADQRKNRCMGDPLAAMNAGEPTHRNVTIRKRHPANDGQIEGCKLFVNFLVAPIV
ncbi:hypothetical protein WJ23_30165 [Burkholderia lata]|uniref:hypothetical protein n=1 Tax=Burkholderia lata (strain ATCC 17760 / DSM 23089 / LMG 22485 / NCIMB 9086 / R18194 / 383) TaxID=482957 RepID=UPI000841387A|nr:hypothetical protein [Burkholderia lata]AOJ42160.1 hypothetical protein WJ23_30165 [Burkholderia lata]